MGKVIKRVLVAVVIILLAVCAILLVRLNQMVQKTGNDLVELLKTSETAPAGVEGEMSPSIKLYGALSSLIIQNGVADEYGSDMTQLANLLINRTIKSSEITAIQMEEDGMLITVQSDGVNVQSLDESFFTEAVTETAMKYIASNLFSLGSVLIGGNQEALESKVIQEFGPQLFGTIEQKISSMPDSPSQQTFKVSVEGNSWKLDPVNTAS